MVNLCRCMLIFSIILGLRGNLDKSYSIGVGVSPIKVHHTTSVLGCQVGSLHRQMEGFTEMQSGLGDGLIESGEPIVQISLVGACGFDPISSKFYSIFSDGSECIT